MRSAKKSRDFPIKIICKYTRSETTYADFVVNNCARTVQMSGEQSLSL